MKEFEIHYKLKTDVSTLNIYAIKEATESTRAEKEFRLFCSERGEELSEAVLVQKTTMVTQKTLLETKF